MTFIEITLRTSNVKRVLNTHHIAHIEPDMVRPAYSMETFAIIHMSDGKAYEVSQAEYNRILSSLTSAPAAAVASDDEPVSHVGSIAWMRAIHIKDLMEDEEMQTLIRTGQRIAAVRLYRKSRDDFQEAKTLVETAMKYSTIPAPLVSAYRQLRKDEIRFANSSTVDEQRCELIDLLGMYVPEEIEVDHE
jgi:hypothetical protein